MIIIIDELNRPKSKKSKKKRKKKYNYQQHGKSIIINENPDVKIGKNTNEIIEPHNTQNEKKDLRDDKDILNRSEELNMYFNNF